MNRTHCSHLAVAAIGAAALLSAVLVIRPGQEATRTDGPQSLREAAFQAERSGLYWGSDQPDGSLTTRLVVSDRPMTSLRANLLPFGNPRHPRWHGVVAVCCPWNSYWAHFNPESSVFWGKMFVMGDPELIRRLVRDK